MCLFPGKIRVNAHSAVSAQSMREKPQGVYIFYPSFISRINNLSLTNLVYSKTVSWAGWTAIYSFTLAKKKYIAQKLQEQDCFL